MNRHFLVSAAAVALMGLGVQGCTKKDQAATANATDATATATANTAGAAADATGNTVASAEGAGPVSDVQDMAAGAVGMASAAAPTDAKGFVTAAAMGDMYELQAAKMAETKATSAEIKTFAKKMVADHTKTSTELKAIVGKGGMTGMIPTALDQRRQGLIDNLNSSKDGHEFDKRYVNQQVAAHREMETLMKGFGEHGDNPALKAFAAKTAGPVAMHLEMAKKLDAEPHNAGTPGGADPAGGKG